MLMLKCLMNFSFSKLKRDKNVQPSAEGKGRKAIRGLRSMLKVGHM